MRRWLSIVGIGEDGLDCLSPAARGLLAQASLVVGGRRHLGLVVEAVTGETLTWPSPPQAAFPAILARRGDPVCVVATGDPFFYGIGSLLARAVPADEMLCLPAASCFGLAASRLGWAVQDCALVSLHGRTLARIVPMLQPRSRILAIAWDGGTPRLVAELLTRLGFGAARLVVAEALGGARERVREALAATFGLDDVDPLNVIGIEIGDAAGGRVIPLAPGLPDDWFEHDGQLTKQDVRAVTLSALAPRRGELLWDIGAGAGSIGIEWMLASSANKAIAIERDAVRAGRIVRNAASLGVPDLEVVAGVAPAVLHGLARPDAVFVGGGWAACIEAAWESLAIGGRLVVNAVTLETQAALVGRYRGLGGSLKMIQISQADAIGGFHALRPAMAVMQWVVTKP